jgi:hypothetical protein
MLRRTFLAVFDFSRIRMIRVDSRANISLSVAKITDAA